jgi:hypothetical protein
MYSAQAQRHPSEFGTKKTPAICGSFFIEVLKAKDGTILADHLPFVTNDRHRADAAFGKRTARHGGADQNLRFAL